MSHLPPPPTNGPPRHEYGPATFSHQPSAPHLGAPPPRHAPPAHAASQPAFATSAVPPPEPATKLPPPPTNGPPRERANTAAGPAFLPADEDKPDDPDGVTWNDMKNYYVNDGPKAIWFGIFGLINIGLFVERFLHYYTPADDKGLRLYDAFGMGLPLARGAAAAIKFNAAVLLFTVMRNFLSFLRTTFLAKFIPLDKNIVFHKGFAWAILFWVMVHMLSHHMNYYYLSITDRQELAMNTPVGGMVGDPRITTWQWAYTLIPGATGHMLVFTMALMYSSAIASIRRPMFEVFWYTHHLFIVFYFLLCIHGFPGVLEPPNAWNWLIAPIILYSLERVVRICRGKEDTVLVMAVMHPGDVIELRMKKNTFNYQAGMYLFLNCPYISSQEWHPFTITSAPEQDFVSVHVRIVGDWTGELKQLLNPNDELGVVCEGIATAPDGRPIFRIDGPFGTASEEVFHHKIVKLVGGGIGVTPFASILRTVRYRTERERATGVQQLPIQKVYFYWLSREAAAFEWFSELLAALEDSDQNGLITIRIFCTSKEIDKKAAEAKTKQTGRDVVTGLRSATTYGRPDWSAIFDQAMVDHPGETIGVFFCGPAAVSKVLYKTSREKTFNNTSGNKFVYLKENF